MSKPIIFKKQNTKNSTNLSSAEFAQGVVKVNVLKDIFLHGTATISSERLAY